MTRREWLALSAAVPFFKASAMPASIEFQCQDLSQYGLPLIPWTSPEYEAMVLDIQQRQSAPVDGAPQVPERYRKTISEADRETSAILVNRSTKAIAGLHAVWYQELNNGMTPRHSFGLLTNRSLLLPFGFPESSRKINAYWNTILPGSKRYLSDGKMIGDNTDVRPPEADENVGSGGVFAGAGGGGTLRAGLYVTHVTLALDGVFFEDGEFVGPNHEHYWEQITLEAAVKKQVGQVARAGRNKGESAETILQEIQQLTGPAPHHPPIFPGMTPKQPDDPEAFRKWAMQDLAFEIFGIFGTHVDPEVHVKSIAAWADTVLPNYRRA